MNLGDVFWLLFKIHYPSEEAYKDLVHPTWSSQSVTVEWFLVSFRVQMSLFTQCIVRLEFMCRIQQYCTETMSCHNVWRVGPIFPRLARDEISSVQYFWKSRQYCNTHEHRDPSCTAFNSTVHNIVETYTHQWCIKKKKHISGVFTQTLMAYSQC